VTSTEARRALRDAAAVEPLGDGHFSLNLSQFYTILDHPNGGYLQCVMANAAVAAASEQGASHLHATSITTNYSGSPELGACEIRTDVRRVGRGVSFVHVTLVQNNVVVTESLVTLGTLRDDSTPRYMGASPPNVAPLEECLSTPKRAPMNLTSVVDIRLDPKSVGWWTGQLISQGEILGWLRLDDGASSWDAWSVLLASDALPPATFPLGSSGWVPTLQLTTYVRRIPTSEWLRARQWCVVIADGLVDERCELFDERGELVASSSQLAMVRFSSTE
jgi:acyl-CoA thioesterase